VAMQAEYDTKNPAALSRLIKSGAKLHTFAPAIMDEAYKVATAVMEEEAAKNAKFKKVYEPWKRFRHDQNVWASVAEQPMQNFLISVGRR
jgi:TRAP-type mannitol/chloroaromatic compound transport system substrate-binding protein